MADFLVIHKVTDEAQLVEAESASRACEMMAWRKEDCWVELTEGY